MLERLITDLQTALTCELEDERASAAEVRTGLKTRERVAAGTCLDGLGVVEDGGRVLGQSMLVLAPTRAGVELPRSRIRQGAVVEVSRPDGETLTRATVARLRGDRITLAISNHRAVESLEGKLILDLLPDERTVEVCRAALSELPNYRGRPGQLRKVMFEGREPSVSKRPSADELQILDDGLNEEQRDAVLAAMRAEDVALIHGPPGTGKTRALLEVIRQSVRRGETVLACAPSNTAVDNVLERALGAGLKAVRLGHPARVAKSVQHACLPALVQESDAFAASRAARKEALERGKWTRKQPSREELRERRQETRALWAEVRELERAAVRSVLETAEVICTTLTGGARRELADRQFGLVAIDEAGQSTMPLSLIPLPRAQRLVFAGDHRQLPPTVRSSKAVKLGLERSLFERVTEAHPGAVSMLRRQYRMHADIMAFPNTELYDGALVADASVAGHTLSELDGVSETLMTLSPVDFVDTAGASADEEPGPRGLSYENPLEAQLVAKLARELLDAGVPPSAIGVITPYNAQTTRLRDELGDPRIEVDTVDGFQGREKEAILLSLVRSNTAGDVGFLSDTRRMNVAMTRARRKLVVVGDSATITSHPFYDRLVGALGDVYRSAFELL